MGRAWFPGRSARRVVETSTDPAVLDGGGFWAVVITFEGEAALWRFADVRDEPLPSPAAPWPGLSGPWRSSLDEAGYRAAVQEVRRRVREGDVYQVNICRVIEADLPVDTAATVDTAGTTDHTGPVDPWALAAVLQAGNPAPYAAVIDVPATGDLPRTRIVSASPELFLDRRGDRVASSPIKGTGRTAADLLPKDEAENVMIVDLVRNDLQHVCRPATVEVDGLLRVEPHPGLVHLVSTVRGRLAAGVTWPDLLAATMPPGSVSGAPKSSALRAIADLEPVPRGPYCGAIGWVDADAGEACLAVGIRTFWWADAERPGEPDRLRFGTGAGITWESDPAAEWAETELKAARLVGLAGGEQAEGGVRR